MSSEAAFLHQELVQGDRRSLGGSSGRLLAPRGRHGLHDRRDARLGFATFFSFSSFSSFSPFKTLHDDSCQDTTRSRGEERVGINWRDGSKNTASVYFCSSKILKKIAIDDPDHCCGYINKSKRLPSGSHTLVTWTLELGNTHICQQFTPNLWQLLFALKMSSGGSHQSN